jgi:hypothetical protein
MQNFPVPKRSLLGFQNFPSPSKLRWGFPDFRSSVIQKISEESLLATEITAKSVILDIADNWGDGTFVGLRQVDFYYEGSKITLDPATDYDAYVTSTYSAVTRDPEFVFDTSLSYTGGASYNSWLSGAGNNTNQRLIVVFTTPLTFDKIVINNEHATNTTGGGESDRGAKNVVMTSSSDEITDTTYGATITNAHEMFNGQFEEHAASDVQDDQILTLVFPEASSTPSLPAIEWSATNKGPDISINGLEVTLGDAGWEQIIVTEGKTSGKWYFEVTCDANVSSYEVAGVQDGTEAFTTYTGDTLNGWGYMANGRFYNSGALTGKSTFVTGDVISVAFDIDTGDIWWAKNGVWEEGDPAAGTGAPYSNLSGTIYPAVSLYNLNAALTGIFKEADFNYSIPTGFSAWNS